MSGQKPLLQSVLDELTESFQRLSDTWVDDAADGFVDGGKLIDETNRILTLFRVLDDADLGDDAQSVREKMQDLKKERKNLAWSAVYVHLERFIG